MIDSHCHLNRLNLAEFNGQVELALKEAQTQGIEHCLTVCVDPGEVPELQALAEQFPMLSFSVGCHPNDVMQHPMSLDSLVKMAAHPACVAIGETGLDYYRLETPDPIAIQKKYFRIHLQASKITRKPVIIHTRAAAEDTLSIMREEHANEIGGVMHCFTEEWSVAKEALDLNFYISFSGIVTFKNAKILHDVAKKVPFDRLLIETDAPYLAPEPYRGKSNHPALVRFVAQKIADLRGISLQEVDRQTTENYYRCFGRK
jgi:TatD DNase family protein